MDRLASRGEIYLVGDLRVDVGQQRVLRGGAEIALPNLSFRLLVALIEAAPNVLNNELLVTRVWPRVVVSPETVLKRVKLLRDALGDEAHEPRYIAVVRSRGYRLVASVARAEDLAVAAVEPPAATPDPALPADMPAASTAIDAVPIPDARRRSGRFVLWGGAIGVLLMLVIAGAWHYRGVPTGTPVSSGAPSAHTIAVLQFDIISAAPSDGYLAQGVPEMILNRLSQVAGLSVIARSSSFALSRTMDSGEIGLRLHAGYLVGGSVQHEGERLRVHVQLVNASTGILVWSSRFDRPLREIFDLEDDISDELAAAIAVRTGIRGGRPAVRQASPDAEAYLAFLRGRALLGRFTVQESEAAIPYFEQATRLDPSFAAAYASLYDAHMQAADGRSEDLAVLREHYRPLIEQALAIDPQSGAAYIARAMWGSSDASVRDADFQRGLDLDPSNGRGLTAYAEFLKNDSPTDQWEKCQRMLRRALEIDPMSPWAHFKAAAWSTESGVSKTAVVEQKMLEVLTLDPNFVPALERYAKYRWLFDGKLAEAIALEEHALALNPDNPWIRQKVVAIYLDLGDEVAARDVAAGTPDGLRRANLMLSMYHGDWRGAGLAAMGDSPWNPHNIFEAWQAGEALRDYALKTGQWTHPIEMLEAKYNLAKNAQAGLALENFRQAFYLSQLQAASGHHTQALELRQAVAVWNDAHEATLGSVYARRLRAGLWLAGGERSAALTELAASFQTGDYECWWYTLRFDPVWAPLHDDPRFQAIAEAVARYIDGQRTELETLRRKGLVPLRAPGAVTTAPQGLHIQLASPGPG